jgi:hypothetical protein
MAATAALAGLSLASAYQDSVAIRMQADEQESNAKMDAAVLRQNASMVEQVANEDYLAFKKKAKRLLGDQLVAQAASGVDISYGSAKELRAETALELEVDANRIKNNATLEAFGLKNKANLLELQAEANARGLRNQANSTLLGGALTAGAYAYMGMGKIKVPKSGESAAKVKSD